jgi:hypothetical protein
MEIAAVTGSPGPDTGWRRPISEYHRLEMIPDDKTEAQRLPCWTKGYLIHDDELYHHNISSILQWSIPVEEGKALLPNIHKGICGHHASSRNMVRKAF